MDAKTFNSRLNAKTFNSFFDALNWGKTYASEHVHRAFQVWRVVPLGNTYRIGVFSKNTGKLTHYAHA